jgi:hypothetical protein
MVELFRMENAHGCISPMDPHIKLKNEQCEDYPAEKHLYQSIFCSFMYAALGTYPNIAYCITALIRYNAIPRLTHPTTAR